MLAFPWRANRVWAASSLRVMMTMMGVTAVIPGATAPAATLNVPAEFPTIQAAIDAANGGDEVVVAAGLYSGPGNTNLDFAGKSITVHSAAGADSCTIDCAGSGRAFAFTSGEAAAAVVDGFTIVNGWATFTTKPGGPFGGAIYISGASPAIVNCIFDGNAAGDDERLGGGGALFASGSTSVVANCHFNGNTTNGYGGGAYAAFGGAVTLDACTFSENGAEAGGGFMCEASSPSVIDCQFTQNIALLFGGGMYSDHGGPAVTDCTFQGNQAPGGGGIEVFGGAATISDSTFVENQANSGAGLRDYQAASTVAGCVFEDNSADNQGGGFVAFESGTALLACTFQANDAQKGGGAFTRNTERVGQVVSLSQCSFRGNIAYTSGGGIELSESSAFLVNCSFLSNASIMGGAVRNEIGGPTFANCTFTANVADAGGAISTSNPASQPLVISNSILWHNLLDQVAGAPASISITYSDVEGGWAGEGNIDADPLFVDFDGIDDDPTTLPDNDVHLILGSPCVDAGSNLLAGISGTIDLDGNSRIVNCTVDLGAYENQNAHLTGDANCDGTVGIDDLLAVINGWGPCPADPDPCPADVAPPPDGNSVVDGHDILLVIQHWSQRG